MRTRALLLAALCAVSGCGSAADLPGPRDTIANWVFSKGGKVVVSGKEGELSSKAQLPAGGYRIERINLNDARITDSDIAQLRDLKSLRGLSLYRTRIGDPAMKDIAGITSLQSLELSYTAITDVGLRRLVELKNLRKLFLRGTEQHVTEAALKVFRSEMPNCEVFR